MSLDRKLPWWERLLIGMHLMMCRYCSRFKKQLLQLRRFSRSRALVEYSVDPSAALPAEARERIKNALRP
jgi:thioredoxin-related protein